ncbi:MAG TPA: hypothetical protein VFR97_05005 [Capillimicrobium sp.]|nr:hypothetical protein [Capillimicrobium sp.]
MSVRFNDRTVCIGSTGSGKSELLNVQFSALRCQRVLYDSKDEFAIDGVTPVHDVDAIDWRQRTIHFVPGDDVLGAARDLFAALNRRSNVVVAVHELSDLCEYRPNATPPSVHRYFRQGRAHGRGLLGGSQRPVQMPTSAATEADHVFIFVPRLAPRDHDAVAEMIGMASRELAETIDRLHEQGGEHTYLHWDRRARTLKAFEPLPERIRKRSIVKRRADA